jgi:hypothetical protein
MFLLSASIARAVKTCEPSLLQVVIPASLKTSAEIKALLLLSSPVVILCIQLLHTSFIFNLVYAIKTSEECLKAGTRTVEREDGLGLQVKVR